MQTELLVRKRIYTSFNAEEDWQNINTDLFNVVNAGVSPWDIINGTAQLSYDGTAASVSILKRYGIEYNKKYRIRYTLLDINGTFVGDFKVKVGGTNGVTRTAAGIYTEEITSGSDNTLQFSAFRHAGGTDPVLILKDVTIEEFTYTSLDLYEDIDINLNYLISDIRDISSKSASYSKEINIPGTSNNTEFFNQVFNINSDTTFSTNKSCSVIIKIDGFEVLNGNLQLKTVNNLRESLEYVVVATDVVKDIFFDMGEKYLDEMDVSSLNHTSTHLNVKNSIISGFDNQTIDYVYPFIDYGMGVQSYANNRSLTDYGTGADTGLLDSDLFPAVRVKYLIDTIFTAYGYTYECDLFDTSEFNKMIIPYSRILEDLWNYTFIQTRYQITQNTAEDYGIYSSPERYSIPVDFITDGSSTLDWGEAPAQYSHNLDVSALIGTKEYLTAQYDYGYDYSLYSWRAFMKPVRFNSTFPANSDPVGSMYGSFNATAAHPPYTYKATQYGKFRFTLRYTTTGVSPTNRFVMRCMRQKAGTITTCTYQDLSQAGYYHPEFWFRDNSGADILAEETLTADAANKTFYDAETDLNYVEVVMEQGDYIWFGWDQIDLTFDEAYNSVMANPNPNNVTISACELDINYFGYMVNTLILGTSIVPKMKQKDFFKSILTMFNLYFERSKSIDRHYIIKTFKDFYTDGSVQDWTNKVDYSKGKEVQIATDFMSKVVEFKFKNEDNYLKNIYEDKKEDAVDNYGDYHIEFDNEFVQDTMEINIENFAILPIGALIDTSLVSSGAIPNIMDPNYSDFDINNYHLYYEEIIAGRTVKGDKNGPDIPSDRHVDPNVGPYLAFFNKVYFYDYLSTYPEPYNPFRIRFNVNTWIPDGYLPYAGHMLNPKIQENSLFDDLSFSQCNPYFYSEHHNAHTGKNLYNIFWKKYIDAINHKDSRLVTMYLKLEATDIFSFSLADKIFIEDTWYIINKIVDWNPILKVTKVELLKIDITTAFDTPIIELVTPTTLDQVTMPTNSIILGARNYTVDNNNIIIGTDNIIAKGSQFNFINGNSNQVSERSKGINITGDNNYISADSNNVTLSNSFNCLVSESSSNIKIDNSQNITVKKGVTNITVSNVNVATTISQSNTSYVNQSQISYSTSLDKSLKQTTTNNISDCGKIDGGRDTVQNMYGDSIINLINGGKDATREYGSNSANNIINGGTS